MFKAIKEYLKAPVMESKEQEVLAPKQEPEQSVDKPSEKVAKSFTAATVTIPSLFTFL